MKLVIGSAQMGMRYGLFNKKKISKVDIDKITRIFGLAFTGITGWYYIKNL